MISMPAAALSPTVDRNQPGIFQRLLPEYAGSTYTGHKFALWLFGLVIAVKAAMGLNAIFNTYMVATRADGVPLATFPPAAVQTVLALFAIWGLGHFVLCLVGLLVLVRYRSLVPFMFVVLLVEQLARKLILLFIPIVRTGRPGGIYVNLGLLAAMALGLGLAMWRRQPATGKQPATIDWPESGR